MMLPSSLVIDSELRLDRSIHNGMAGFEHLPKTDTQRYQSFVVRDIETPNAAGPNVGTRLRCSKSRLAEMLKPARQGEHARRQTNAAT